MLVAPATTVAAAKFLHKSKAKRVSALVSEFEGVPDKEGGEVERSECVVCPQLTRALIFVDSTFYS